MDICHVIMGCYSKIKTFNNNFRIKQRRVDFKFEELHTVFAGTFLGFDQLKEDRPR